MTDKRFYELSGQAEIIKNELQSLKAAGNIQTYNLRVPLYNALVGRMQQDAGVHNYILEHQYDRAGTYAWVKDHAAGL
jgi:hypothetical protein